MSDLSSPLSDLDYLAGIEGLDDYEVDGLGRRGGFRRITRPLTKPIKAISRAPIIGPVAATGANLALAPVSAAVGGRQILLRGRKNRKNRRSFAGVFLKKRGTRLQRIIIPENPEALISVEDAGPAPVNIPDDTTVAVAPAPDAANIPGATEAPETEMMRPQEANDYYVNEPYDDIEGLYDDDIEGLYDDDIEGLYDDDIEGLYDDDIEGLYDDDIEGLYDDDIEGLEEDVVIIDGLGRLIRTKRQKPRGRSSRRPIRRATIRRRRRRKARITRARNRRNISITGRHVRPVSQVSSRPSSAITNTAPAQNNPNPQRIATPTTPMQVAPQDLKKATPQAWEKAGELIAAQYPKWFDGKTNQSYFRNYMLSYLHPNLADLGGERKDNKNAINMLLIGGAIALGVWFLLKNKK